MKQKLFAIAMLCALVMVAAPAPKAFAHVLVTDKKSNSSAVLHITPDDDPEAGKPAEFYYELQTSVNPTTFSEYRLYITDEAGKRTQIPVNTTSHSIAGEYTFPAQGLYKLELASINPWKNSFDLRYSLRVSRGAVGGATMAEKYAWTKPVLIAVGVGGALLVVTLINNRKAIGKHSTF